MSKFYDLTTVYVEDEVLATFEVEGSDEKIVRYYPAEGQPPEDWLLRVANEQWTTQQFLMYFPRGSLTPAKKPERTGR